MSEKQQITEIQNTIIELLEKRQISANDFVLYVIYRNIAGDQDTCQISTRTLEKKCGLSDKTITKSKQVLSRKFDLLNGKSLIEITRHESRRCADTVKLTNLGA